jgi:hypothetical protein
VSRLPLLVYHDDRQESGRQQLLALWQMRRDLEHVAPRQRRARSARLAVNRAFEGCPIEARYTASANRFDSVHRQA